MAVGEVFAKGDQTKMREAWVSWTQQRWFQVLKQRLNFLPAASSSHLRVLVSPGELRTESWLLSGPTALPQELVLKRLLSRSFSAGKRWCRAAQSLSSSNNPRTTVQGGKSGYLGQASGLQSPTVRQPHPLLPSRRASAKREGDQKKGWRFGVNKKDNGNYTHQAGKDEGHESNN